MLQVVTYETDMLRGVTMQRMGRLFASGDKAAHTFQVRVQNADLSGYSADGYMIRADQASVPITAKIKGDTVIATLPEACYAVSGGFSLILRATKSDERTAVFWGVGTITRSHTDSVVNVDNKIPSLDDLLAQIKKMEEATNSANTATNSANEATTKAKASAEKADLAAESANAMAKSAYVAATNANSATQTAKTAAAKIDDMTVQVSMLEAGTSPTANLELVDGHYNLSFSIPKGDKGATGATPKIAVKVVTGEPGTAAKVEQSGTAEAPVITLTIPRGNTGSIENLTINGKSVENGTITLTAKDVGARSGDWMPTASEVGALEEGAMAVDSSKLGGKAPEYYIQPMNLLDNSRWDQISKIVNQRGKTTYTGKTYTIDRWYMSADDAKIVLNNGYITIHNGALIQKINIAPNKTYTAAVRKTSGSIIVVSGTFTDGFGSVEIGITGSVSNGYPRLSMESVLGNVVWAALYEGSYTADTLPPYVPKGYAHEMAECQRYYYVYRQWMRACAKPDNLNVGHLNIPFPIPMRTNPSLQYEIAEGKAPTIITANTFGIESWSDNGVYTLANISATADF